jgi:hypothetical protein
MVDESGMLAMATITITITITITFRFRLQICVCIKRIMYDLRSCCLSASHIHCLSAFVEVVFQLYTFIQSFFYFILFEHESAFAFAFACG